MLILDELEIEFCTEQVYQTTFGLLRPLSIAAYS
jgi:hypothetical protein